MQLTNIHKAYVFKILNQSFSFFAPVYIIFLQQNTASVTQVSFLIAWAFFVALILEVPSGYFADIYGRRLSLIIAAYAMTIGCTIYVLSEQYINFLIAETIFSVGLALMSGADTSLVYDSLKENNEENQFKSTWGKTVFYWMVASAAFNLIGPLFAGINIKFPLYFALAGFIISIPIAHSFSEPERHQLIIKKGYLKELWQVCRTKFWHNKKIVWLTVTASIIYISFFTSYWFYQPYYELVDIPVIYFGIIFATLNIFAALTARYADKIEQKFGANRCMLGLLVVLPLSMFMMGAFVSRISIALTYVQQFARGFYRTVFDDFVQRLTTSDVRATVSSIANMFQSLAFSIFVIFFGYYIDKTDLPTGLIHTSPAILVAGIIAYYFFQRSNNSTP